MSALSWFTAGVLYGMVSFVMFATLLAFCGMFLIESRVTPEIEWLEEYNNNGYDGFEVMFIVAPRACRWRIVGYFLMGILWPIVLSAYFLLYYKHRNGLPEEFQAQHPLRVKFFGYVFSGFGKFKPN